ncbi:PQQ-binding-like beta-propeller repeat protein [Tepidanaerobacter acetatoxydans]|uniref:peptidoglycan-binding protein n=1 Tax=Tepidanaerobacter acetatoxydans TaxID=499229 RepID=UPI00020BF735|nr:PQQ-binding-like beta-propeller repeat protein [Tepidanaerobacter acetatoxydans]AEE92580.1 Peptidoglycan-binding domain 1 protein [Tepidanaerobacter acetatoxydans Re1]
MRLPVIPFGSRPLKKQKPLLKGSDVRHLQQVLKRLGVFNARIDGVFGYETMQAVREFQRAFHIKQNGIVDDDEFEILKELMRCGINKWRTIQRDYRHSGYSPVPIPKQLKISWIRPIPDIIGLNCSADRLIVTTRKEVLAIDLKSGERLWKSSELFPESSSTIFEGHVIVPAGSLAILDFYSGKTQKTLKQDNFILPAAANKTQIYAPSSGTLYCFNQSGDMKWNYKTYGAYITSPAIGYDFVYFASYDRCIYCLDEKGILCWKTKISDIIQIPPAIWDGKVFTISCDSWVSALNPLVGEIIWRKKIADEEFMMPAFHQDFMLLANYRGEVTALSFQRAEVIWVIDLPDAPTTLPIVCPNTFFIGTESGLMAYDIKTLDAKTHLEGKKITAIVPGAMSLFAATQRELIKLSPE